MASIESLSDGELRHKLAELGFSVGPVTDTSRKVLIKKLKHLMVQARRSSDGVSGTDKWRRSASHFSSGEESENDDIKTRLNRTMPPPSSNIRNLRRKSTGRLNENSSLAGRMGRRKEINLRSDLFCATKTSTPITDRHAGISAVQTANPVAIRNANARRSSTRAMSSLMDGFDTGSDSDIEKKKWKNTNNQVSPSVDRDSVPYSSSFLSRMSSIRRKRKGGSGVDDDNSVDTLLGFRKSILSSETDTADTWSPPRSATVPFQSNFVKRLSGSSVGATDRGSTPSSIYDVKENDEESNSTNGVFSPSRWSGVSSHSDLSQEFKITEDETKFGWNSQFISKILLVVATLFFTALAVMYINVRSRDAISFSIEEKANVFPICSDDGNLQTSAMSNSGLCIEHENLLPAVKVVKILHPELYERAINQQCYGGPPAHMTHSEAYKWIRRKDESTAGDRIEAALRSLKILLISNPHWGISVIEIPVRDNVEHVINFHHLVNAGGLLVSKPYVPLLCYLKKTLNEILILFQIIVFVACFLIGLKLGVQWYMHRRELERMEVFAMVERIIELLVNHQKNSPPGQPRYLAVNHVRDQLIVPSERKRLAAVWNKAVNWIKNSESRVRCELQSIAGEEFPVWRWLPNSTSLHTSSPRLLEQSSPRRNNKVWQGQAFDTMTGSPNSLPCSPTPCLKIRHMFDLDMEFGDEWPVRVQDAVLEKCGEQGVTALHVSVDRASREGCVYLKCASQEDAGKAYRALHGWWFDSNLVTVKYLRLERYCERFPEAETATHPLRPSNNQKLSLQWQSPLENN